MSKFTEYLEVISKKITFEEVRQYLLNSNKFKRMDIDKNLKILLNNFNFKQKFKTYDLNINVNLNINPKDSSYYYSIHKYDLNGDKDFINKTEIFSFKKLEDIKLLNNLEDIEKLI